MFFFLLDVSFFFWKTEGWEFGVEGRAELRGQDKQVLKATGVCEIRNWESQRMC